MNTDNAGNTPEVGDYVAYNWSGQIATGFIAGMGRSKLSPIYKIERVIPEQRQHEREKPISTVRGGARCLLVLDKAGS